MLFSQHFKITKSKVDDWFDLILDYDTRLFIDPFLILKSKHNNFKKSHNKIISFFTNVFILAAKTSRVSTSMSYKRLVYLNLFPEVEEICLGYASESTKGAGSGHGFGKNIVQALFESIDLGIASIDHFEELGIIHKGIGPDRISDMAANILKKDFISYTQEICIRHKIAMKKNSQRILSKSLNKWNIENVELPKNPFNNKAIILIPEKFLNNLPEINDQDFYYYCADQFGDHLRTELNIDILSKVNKEKIIEIAKSHRDWVKIYLQFKNQQNDPKSYDLKKDPEGLYIWAIYCRKYVDQYPLRLDAEDKKSFLACINILVNEFKIFIELRGGQKLLWDEKGTKSKREEASQLLFLGNSRLYCMSNGIVVDREVNLGVGPVDFKFSNGYKNRCLLEVKLARNSKFWNGLDKQIVKYMEADNISEGYFMVICYVEKDFERIKDIEKRVDALNRKLKIIIRVLIIDATFKKPSASNLH